MDFDFWRQENPVMIFKKLENKTAQQFKENRTYPCKSIMYAMLGDSISYVWLLWGL